MKNLLFILIILITSCKPVLYTDFKNKDIKYPIKVVKINNSLINPYSIIVDMRGNYYKLNGKTCVYKEGTILNN